MYSSCYECWVTVSIIELKYVLCLLSESKAGRKLGIKRTTQKRGERLKWVEVESFPGGKMSFIEVSGYTI